MWLAGPLTGAASGSLYGQGTTEPVYVLRTEGAAGLVTVTTPIDLRGFLAPVFLDFNFGFGTDEIVRPGEILDAFTISLGSVTNPAQMAVYLTLDAAGLVVAPPTPGGIWIDPASLDLTPGLPPPGFGYLRQQLAYHVLAPVPEVLWGQETTLYLDLFNNANGLESIGWAGAVTVIPEPSVGLLCLVGLAAWLGLKRRPIVPA